MKSDKKLKEVFEKAKNDNMYYDFATFKDEAKRLLRDIKGRKFICSMTVSKSGMTRTFNTVNHNAVLNICYNQKVSYDKIKVGGCGMNMLWHLLFTACEQLCTNIEIEKYNLNMKCSDYIII